MPLCLIFWHAGLLLRLSHCFRLLHRMSNFKIHRYNIGVLPAVRTLWYPTVVSDALLETTPGCGRFTRETERLAFQNTDLYVYNVKSATRTKYPNLNSAIFPLEKPRKLKDLMEKKKKMQSPPTNFLHRPPVINSAQCLYVPLCLTFIFISTRRVQPCQDSCLLYCRNFLINIPQEYTC